MSLRYLFFKVPSPIPFPKKPPLIIESKALSDWKLYVPFSVSKKDNNLFLIYSNFETKKLDKKRQKEGLKITQIEPQYLHLRKKLKLTN